MDEALFTWYQGLQLLAVGPCIFMVFFLCISSRNFLQVLVPGLYFLSLTSSFILPLQNVLALNPEEEVRGLLLLGESLTPALSFLLVVQFITGRIPSFPYWAILAVPLVGGVSIVYASLIARGEVCIYDNLCTDPIVFKQLYEIFSASLTFLLTLTVYHRLAHVMEGSDHQRQHKYALILALVILNLAVFVIDLAQVSGHVDTERAALAITVVRIGFIYLVLTSVFRVFDRSFSIAYDRIPHMRPAKPSDRDLQLADQIRKLLLEDKLYRSMELSRGKLALRLAVSEHNLSRIINQCFDQNFNTLINHYRVIEAKERLAKEDTAITIIAFDVGFSSIPSFNRVFKSTTGLSPSEYRNRRLTEKN